MQTPTFKISGARKGFEVTIRTGVQYVRILVDDLLEANNPANGSKQQVQPSVTTSTATTTVRGVLPDGWEERFTPGGLKVVPTSTRTTT